MKTSSARAIGLSLLGVGALGLGCSPGQGHPTGAPGSGFVAPLPVDAGTLALRRDGGGPPADAGFNGRSLGSSVGPTRIADDPPPPLSGGTLLVTRDGRAAVAADPDRDRVWIVDLGSRTVTASLELRAGDEPGRAVEDDAGRVHLALRGGASVLSVDMATRAVLARRPVCAAPRGIAYERDTGLLHVACAGGELVSLRAGTGEVTRTLRLDRDLRDVIVQSGQLVVSRFREAELLTVDASGEVVRRVRPANADELPGRGVGLGGRSGVAWRMIAGPGGALVLHQRAITASVQITTGGYGSTGRCQTGVVQSTVSMIGTEAPVALPSLSGVTLAVDVALAPGGQRMAIAAAGNAPFPTLGQVFAFSLSELPSGVMGSCATVQPVAGVTGQAVAVAFTPSGQLVVQTREPAAIVLPGGAGVTLSGESRGDTGHTLFHANAGAFMACASCHPEGGDDGHIWTFLPIGSRRTQNLRGSLAGTAPFHWDGDMATFTDLAHDVFGQRMSGGALAPDQVAALERWTTTLPTIPASPVREVGTVARGRALFADAVVGCSDCHSGPHFTNNATVDVGTSGAFQVPSLVGVAWRTPLMHNGCARTLRERFTECGGDERHGRTAHLTEAQISDLVAYLETL
ncbi:MAG: c-type cytochrome [Deltaproteobacteria bacterium]|nr:c-type cytochrome [Deltaproteobacteria bacterium]